MPTLDLSYKVNFKCQLQISTTGFKLQIQTSASNFRLKTLILYLTSYKASLSTNRIHYFRHSHAKIHRIATWLQTDERTNRRTKEQTEWHCHSLSCSSQLKIYYSSLKQRFTVCTLICTCSFGFCAISPYCEYLLC